MTSEEATKYYFEVPHLIVAYKDELFAGIMVTNPGVTLTKEELVLHFSQFEPDCFVIEKLPIIEGEVTFDEYTAILQEIIHEYMVSSFSSIDKPDLLYIPKTLH